MINSASNYNYSRICSQVPQIASNLVRCSQCHSLFEGHAHEYSSVVADKHGDTTEWANTDRFDWSSGMNEEHQSHQLLLSCSLRNIVTVVESDELPPNLWCVVNFINNKKCSSHHTFTRLSHNNLVYVWIVHLFILGRGGTLHDIAIIWVTFIPSVAWC